MPTFERWSIKTKLVLLATASATVALLFATTAFVIEDLALLRRTKIEQLESEAQILGYTCAPLMLARDKYASQQLLWSLDESKGIERAALFSSNGALFAESCDIYSRGDSQPHYPDFVGYRMLGPDRVEVFWPILDSGKEVGGVYLRATLKELRREFASHLWIAGLVLGGAIGVATAIAAALQRRLTRPILTLAATARRITTESNYNLRVTPTAPDEIGVLYQDFNSMLDQIELHKRALRDVQLDLERRVIERTQQLVDEIVQREHAQKELVRARDAAESANKAKSAFLANMSHEMRTPLNAVLGFTELLRRNAAGSPAEAHEFLDTIHSSGKHLLDLINDILDLSRIEAGKMSVDRVRFSPQQTLSEVVSSLRVAAAQKGLSLHYTWSSPVIESIESDPARLRQLALNLIGNAIKFTERGEVRVVASVDRRARELVVAVSDTGIGIAPDQRESIFGAFVQADESVTRKHGGTGLGLSICQHIVRALGGRIGLQSQVGRGSTFTVAIPTGALDDVPNIEPASDGSTGEELPAPHARKSSSLDGARILVIEDNEATRRLIDLVLTRAGSIVAAHSTSQEGIDAAGASQFDLALIDLQMPAMDGYAIAAALRDQGFPAPIVALAAFAGPASEAKCRAAGFSSIATTPIDPSRLLEELRTTLARESELPQRLLQ